METFPIREKDFAAAKRQYLETHGSLAVMNTYLRLALLGISGVAVALAWLNVKAYQAFHHLQPLVIRINEAGRAQAINYGSLAYQPQEAELKYFLVQFTHAYYGRMRATVREAYPQSLYFLEGRLADAAMESNKRSKVIESFLASHADEIDVQVKNVAIEDLRMPPYKATVDFQKVYLSAADHSEIRRERYVANFVFVVKQPVANALIPVNPLGLTITYFREDQAFQEEKP